MKQTIRSIQATLLVAALSLATLPAARAQGLPTEDEIINAKCTLCHSSKRILTLDPAQIKPVLERMQKMNPDWISDVERDHAAGVLANILGDPGLMMVREAWKDAVERGGGIFNDTGLGKSGKACASCHKSGSLRQVADAYPQFDPKLKRFVDLNEAINLMVKEKVGGEPFPANDQRLFDLIAYLKSLK